MKTPKGYGQNSRFPVGSIRIRVRTRGDGEQRAYIKTAEPKTWVLLARHVWESHNGPIPRGMGIHHKDRNKLNDHIDNLELVSKADHLREHYPEFAEKNKEATRRALTGRTWSTKSKTKRVGRHPKGCQCPLHRPA